ncbi:hypothetical protein [Rufibacter sp. LB8]|uniref:hypothetical protein n=1 Tax=Rufibacter sp. LB8 TaxID=2777781 RepID=UPI00178C4F38|nr:hypothetical protein [Rufibacter sp. LB8]
MGPFLHNYKKLILGRLLPLLTGLLFMASSCKKEEISEIERLPAATQEGKNTFGCLVNGKAHFPTGQMGFGVPSYQCHYQNIQHDDKPKGYYFYVAGADMKSKNRALVNVGTSALALKEGEVYPLTTRGTEGRAFGEYIFFGPPGEDLYMEASALTGELRITKLDEQRHIVAGTFWFDTVNSKGEKVEVREGRFDMVYRR